ncbi:hypothetical protein KM295_02405 [Natronomonas sp. F2-12]|uniref:Uncharacterized protein n=1 Tax=Natronomonas aquatica TaxID=2841590 RepID=A0A9R1CQU8_9EURY|nr:hypothetical protein [Natronomonas aquatica]MCQ4332357.1 hypothetical protein [Natronomonas aquatica]
MAVSIIGQRWSETGDPSGRRAGNRRSGILWPVTPDPAAAFVEHGRARSSL